LVVLSDGLADNLLVILLNANFWIKIYTGKVSKVTANLTVAVLGITTVGYKRFAVRHVALRTLQI